MKKTLGFILVLAFVLSCTPYRGSEEIVPVQFDNSYQPAIFQDAERTEKIKTAFPVIDSIYKKFAAENHFPGLAFGLVVDGQLVYTGTYGYTDLEEKTAVTTSSLFRVASMSKSFAAMAILRLRDEAKLNLDDPAFLYIPELRKLKYPTADAPHITIRHLLTHGAGFPEDNPWGDRQLADSDREFMEFIGRQISFSNPPGIEYEYSNLGFALLGKIITVVSGQRYQDYIKKHIWEPLGMHHSTYEFAEVEADKLAHGYRWLNEKWNEEELLHDSPDGSWGAMGSMISSIDEFANYLAFHLSSWPPNNSPEVGPIKRSSVREMHHPWRWNGMNANNTGSDGKLCPSTSAYTYGLRWSRDCQGKTFIGHSGGLPGFGSNWTIMPDYGIGIVAFANRTYSPITYINTVVLDTLIKIADLKPRQMQASIILEKRKTELMAILPDWSKAEASGIFAENFFPDYPIDSLKKESRLLFEKAGKVISVGEMRAMNQLRGFFTIEGQLTNMEVFFTLSPENPPLIQAFRIREVGNK